MYGIEYKIKRMDKNKVMIVKGIIKKILISH